MSGPANNPDWGAVERVLAAVLELPAESQAAYLAQQPPAIRSEVESLLAAYRRSGNFLGDETGDASGAPGVLDRMKAVMAVAEGASVSEPIAIAAGTQLGFYRIEAAIGEGGMGVVYRALDTRLNRHVAVKFLFDELADPAARRRFQREAQMASALNHPHILTVHDVGDFDGRQYLVTEFVDGGTLKDWSKAQKRSAREIATLLVGVADGLAAAHAAGILHRDIKPDNILISKSGYAKLSDFGLAKLDARISQDAATQTLGSKSTRPGIILGTFAYMSPEQASGQPTDARGDIFSFGIVLYELLAGRRPFQGATDMELLQNIIHSAPQPLSTEVPPALRMVVEKSLEKDPCERYQSTRDLVVDLRRVTRQSGASAGSGGASAGSAASSASVEAAPAPARAARKTGLLAALALTLLLLAACVFLLLRKQPVAQAPQQAVQFDITPPAGTIFAPPIMRQPFAISPNGSRLAFTATGANGTNVWVRDLASLDMRTVPDTANAESVFWSPDSRSVYYSVRHELKQVDLQTGSGRSVVELPDRAQLGTWRSPGDLLLYLGAGGNYYELLVGNGALRETALGKEMRWPQFLPGGNHFVSAFAPPSSEHAQAMLSEYASPKPVPLMQTDSRVQYAPPRRAGEPGYLLFLRGSSLMAQPFDPDRLRLAGDPYPIAANVVYYGSTLSPCFSVSENGVLVYQSGFPISELKWYDRAGNPVSTVGRPAPYWGTLRISVDGRRAAAIVFGPDNGGTDIWLFDASGRESRQLTFRPEQARRPIWSPDGKRLAYGWSMPGSHPELATIAVDGSGREQPLLASWPDKVNGVNSPRGLPTDWSRDGRFIVFDSGIPEESPDVWIADVPGGKIMPLLRNKFPEWGAAFAPTDGKQLAFVTAESGRPEVYLQAFEDAPSPSVVGERRQVSRDGAWVVRWRADGRELFYLGTDNWLYAVPVTGKLQAGEPQKLFRVPGTSAYATTSDFQFDVSPNGQQFLMSTTGSTPPPAYTVIQNWQDKIHR